MDTRKLATIAVAAAVALLTLLIMREAMAQECFAEAEIVAAVDEIEGAVIVHDLRGDDATAWVADFNRRSPTTNLMADQILVIGRAGNPMVFIWLLLNGCAVHAFALPAAPALQVIDGILGTQTWMNQSSEREWRS
jgi:hypothetical protein